LVKIAKPSGGGPRGFDGLGLTELSTFNKARLFPPIWAALLVNKTARGGIPFLLKTESPGLFRCGTQNNVPHSGPQKKKNRRPLAREIENFVPEWSCEHPLFKISLLKKTS